MSVNVLAEIALQMHVCVRTHGLWTFFGSHMSPYYGIIIRLGMHVTCSVL